MCKVFGLGIVGKLAVIVTIIVWFVLIGFLSSQTECVKFHNCGGDDLILFGILAIGMMPLSCLIGRFFDSRSLIDQISDDDNK